MAEISGQLDRYMANPGELQTVLDQVRVLLLARQASILPGALIWMQFGTG